MKHNARTNALVGAGVAACAVAGTLLNEPQSRWYRSLRKPDWQPAPAVFPIAWTALYAAVGLSSASVINRLNKAGWDQDAAAFARALGVNLALNTGWKRALLPGPQPARRHRRRCRAGGLVGRPRPPGRHRRRLAGLGTARLRGLVRVRHGTDGAHRAAQPAHVSTHRPEPPCGGECSPWTAKGC